MKAIQPDQRAGCVLPEHAAPHLKSIPEFGNYSPGLILDLIRHCADSGITRMDLGRGHERYKLSLMTGVAPTVDGCVTVRLIDRMIQRASFGSRALARSGLFRWPMRHSKSVVRRWLTASGGPGDST
jgi:CelD/BcsL family acetyltransferase involved in cellulose biosynthesis